MVAVPRCLSCLTFFIGAAVGARLHRQARLNGSLTNQNEWEEHKIETSTRTTWEGWGVAMSWWANLFGDDPAIADLVWTTKEGINVGPKPELQNLPGLGLNIPRYNVGGSVGAERDGTDAQPGRIDEANLVMDYSNIADYKRIQGFWLNWFDKDPDSASWNWNADQKQINMLVMAKDRGANVFELFSNSPMWWMTKSKNPAGTKESGGENLQDWNIGDHAYYLGQVAKRFKEQYNISFHSVSPFNEPRGNNGRNCWWNSSPGNNGQEGNCMGVAQQSQVVKAVYDEFNRIGLGSVLISASEENSFDQGKATWRAMDSETQSMTKQINVHGYSQLSGDREYFARQGKVLWMSEYSNNDQWSDGAAANGMVMAQCIHYDFEYLGMSSWSYWQILDQTWGWGMIKFGNSAEEGWWGENKENWYLEPKFWVLVHFTRHIRQGMHILYHNSFDGNGAYTVAAYSPEEKKLVLVTTNFANDRWVNYDLTAFTSIAGKGFSWVTEGGGSTKYQQPEASGTWDLGGGKHFGSQFAPYMVKTFELHDVEL